MAHLNINDYEIKLKTVIQLHSELCEQLMQAEALLYVATVLDFATLPAHIIQDYLSTLSDLITGARRKSELIF